MGEKRTVVVVATLDTKGQEAAFVRDQIATWGLDAILIDPGVLGTPSVEPDISRAQVAEAGGTTLEALLAQGEEGEAIAKQTEGLCILVRDLYAHDRLHGIISLGGGQGTSIGTAAMRALPVGVPKLMLSPIASGSFQFGHYVGTSDICMMNSITDILGINVISRPILRNAANAIAGMALGLHTGDLTPRWRSLAWPTLASPPLVSPPPASPPGQAGQAGRAGQAVAGEKPAEPAIAITHLGITTSCVMRIKEQLEEQGYALVPFHSNGTGGPAMEDLIREGKFVGVIDLNPHEVIDHRYGGLAGAPNRFEALAQVRIPAVVSVGGNDYLLFETLEKAPKQYRKRAHMVDNMQMTCVAPTPKEMIAAAREIIERLNRALGPTVVVLPLKGFSVQNRDGGSLYVPEGNQAVVTEFRKALRPDIPIIQADLHINDPEFANLVSACMARLLKGESPQDIGAQFGATLAGRGQPL